MRARTLLVLVVGSTLSSAAFMFACGGSETTPTPVDSGADVTLDVAKDVTPDVGPVDAGCLTDVSLNDLVPPDAAIGDSGATLPGCATCLKTSCSSDINACDKVCECRDAVNGVYKCLGQGKGFQQCAAANFIGAGQETQSIGLSLGQCATASCFGQCGLGSLLNDAGLDSGPKDAGGQ